MNNRDIFVAYLDAFTAGDIETAKQYLAEDFQFDGPFVKAESKDEFFSQISPDLITMTRGYKLLQQFEAGDELCSIYEYNIETPVGQGAIYMTEWNKVQDNQLKSARLLFDSAQFNALMPS